MQQLSSIDDVRRLVYSNKIAVVVYLGSDEELNSYVTRVVRSIESVSKNAIAYGLYRVGRGSREAVVIVYVDGREVLEQRYYFMNLDLDVKALKMGIRSVINALGLTAPF
jgi:protein tyrosine phosphatase